MLNGAFRAISNEELLAGTGDPLQGNPPFVLPSSIP
jgi:hypothetical protein